MDTKIRCYTLFDITRTGISNRRAPNNIQPDRLAEWEENRNRQCNFDTLIQVISLRTQPEDITNPSQEIVMFNDCDFFGFLFEQEEAQTMWTFDFTVNYQNVYNDGISELGALYTDCDGVPMIRGLGEWNKLPDFLDTSVELRNIYFEVI